MPTAAGFSELTAMNSRAKDVRSETTGASSELLKAAQAYMPFGHDGADSALAYWREAHDPIYLHLIDDKLNF